MNGDHLLIRPDTEKHAQEAVQNGGLNVALLSHIIELRRDVSEMRSGGCPAGLRLRVRVGRLTLAVGALGVILALVVFGAVGTARDVVWALWRHLLAGGGGL